MKLWIAVLLISNTLLADELLDTGPMVREPSNIYLSMGPGIILGEQKTRPGVALDLSGRVSKELPLYAGLEWGSFFETGGEFTALFALLPSVSYLLNPEESIRPMFGLAIGPGLSTGTDDDIRLVALFKPGVQFELSEAISIHFQSKFGMLGSHFVFIPSFGTAFMI